MKINKIGYCFILVISMGFVSSAAVANIKACENTFDNCYHGCQGNHACKLDCLSRFEPCMKQYGCKVDQKGFDILAESLAETGGIDNNALVDAFGCPGDEE